MNPYNNLALGDTVRLNGAHPEARPWTITRLGIVGEQRDPVATIVRDCSGGNVAREVVHVNALTHWDEEAEIERRARARKAWHEAVDAVEGE